MGSNTELNSYLHRKGTRSDPGSASGFIGGWFDNPFGPLRHSRAQTSGWAVSSAPQKSCGFFFLSFSFFSLDKF